MPDVAGGWLCLLLGALCGILGGKLYILGVAGYVTPIWDVLAPQREQEEAGEHLWGDRLLGIFPIRDSFPIRQAVPVGLPRARFFLIKRMYYSRYNTYVCILHSSVAQRWVDAYGWV